jgi:hypothetical protein
MKEFYFDILNNIFSYLTPREQTQISRTNQLFYQVYKSRDENIIDPTIHGFYRDYGWKILVYRFNFADKHKKYININLEDVIIKRELLRCEEGFYYCEDENFKYLKCNLKKTDKLFKRFCIFCDKLENCTIDKNLQYICAKCYEEKYFEKLYFCRYIDFN